MLEYADDTQGEVVGHRRHVNTISLLLPAKQYSLNCSWTTERPLPAIEEFSCRLILLFDGVAPFEVREYFGLSEIELNGLIDSLLKKRLIEMDPNGLIKASSILRLKNNNDQEVPTLTAYDTREESAVFDLLTLSIIPRRSYQGIKYGLPEIPPPEKFGSVGLESIVEQFGRQYRIHLENTRSSGAEKTRLYKVSHCRPVRTLQVPIDMEISLEVVSGEGIRVYRDAVERVGPVRKNALSNELEAQIADYLAKLAVPSHGHSFQDFCEAIGDEILSKYSTPEGFDLASWLQDRENKKTGYGSSTTRGILGPVYLESNAIAISKTLGSLVREEGADVPNMYWYPASVPLWGANGTDLEKFISRLEKELNSNSESVSNVITFFNIQENKEIRAIKKSFNARLPHVVSLQGGSPQDRVEIIVIPGFLAIAQYHVQPNSDSCVTIPVGLLTTDPVRMKKIENLLQLRMQGSTGSEILWSKSNVSSKGLIDKEFLRLESRPQADDLKEFSGDQKKQTSIKWKAKKRF